MTRQSPVLGMHGVAKSFATPQGPVRVLCDLHLEIAAGDFVAITGPSGSGKSTCLHLAALLDSPDDGRILFEGEDVSLLDERRRAAIRAHRIGMVFQRCCLLPHRSVTENVRFRYRYVEHDPARAQAATHQALTAIGLEHLAGRQARLLSGGEMQRVAIARAIALEPALLIADEPTGNLDRSATQQVMETFRELNRTGLAILMVTHNDALLQYSTRCLRLSDRGRLAQ